MSHSTQEIDVGPLRDSYLHVSKFIHTVERGSENSLRFRAVDGLLVLWHELFFAGHAIVQTISDGSFGYDKKELSTASAHSRSMRKREEAVVRPGLTRRIQRAVKPSEAALAKGPSSTKKRGSW